MIVKDDNQKLVEKAKHNARDLLDVFPAENATIIVDFEMNLWLRNPTEEYLSQCPQSSWFAIFFQLIDLLFPWGLLTKKYGPDYRSTLKISLFEQRYGNLYQKWLASSSANLKKYLNNELVSKLRGRQRPIVLVCRSPERLVKPLLAHLNDIEFTDIKYLHNADIDEQLKKLSSLSFVDHDTTYWITPTDQYFDNYVKHAQLLCPTWPRALAREAGLRPLLPFGYTTRIKRYGEKYFRNAVLGHDYLLLLLVFALYSDRPVQTALSLAVGVLSFFSFYELGYYENDMRGYRRESKARISPRFLALHKNFNPYFALGCGIVFWTLAAALATPVSWLPDQPGSYTLEGFFTVWVGFGTLFFFTALSFVWHNRLRFRGRIFSFLLLQGARTMGYVMVFPTSAFAGLYCMCWAYGKFFPYFVYRFSGSGIGMPNHFLTIVLFITMAAPWYLTGLSDWGELLEPQALIIIVYSLLRAGVDLYRFRGQLAFEPPRSESNTAKSENKSQLKVEC